MGCLNLTKDEISAKKYAQQIGRAGTQMAGNQDFFGYTEL
jgi:hypothetical protein